MQPRKEKSEIKGSALVFSPKKNYFWQQMPQNSRPIPLGQSILGGQSQF